MLLVQPPQHKGANEEFRDGGPKSIRTILAIQALAQENRQLQQDK